MPPTILVSYLQMTSPPQSDKRIAPGNDLYIKPVNGMKPEEFLDLYKRVGGPSRWPERKLDVIESLFQDPAVSIALLHNGEKLAGFCEIHKHDFPEVEIKCFGLLPQFIGQGLGTFFLDHVVRAVWKDNPKRLWLHTDEWDHPNAINTYQKIGFAIYQQQIEEAHTPMPLE